MVLSWYLQVGTEENHQNFVIVVGAQVYNQTRHMPNTIRLMTYKKEEKVHKHALC
jgi:hypothetical protein